MHLGLRSIVCINTTRRQSRLPAFTLVRHLAGSIPVRGGIEDSAREFNVFSRNLEVGLVPTMGIAVRQRHEQASRYPRAWRGRADRRPGTRYGPEDNCIGSVPRSAAAPLATSRHLEAARESLTDGRVARILGDGAGDQNGPGDQTCDGRVEDRSMIVDD